MKSDNCLELAPTSVAQSGLGVRNDFEVAYAIAQRCGASLRNAQRPF